MIEAERPATGEVNTELEFDLIKGFLEGESELHTNRENYALHLTYVASENRPPSIEIVLVQPRSQELGREESVECYRVNKLGLVEVVSEADRTTQANILIHQHGRLTSDMLDEAEAQKFRAKIRNVREFVERIFREAETD